MAHPAKLVKSSSGSILPTALPELLHQNVDKGSTNIAIDPLG